MKKVLFVVDKSGFGGIQTIATTLMQHNVGDEVQMCYFFLRNINDRFGMKDIDRPDVFYSHSSGRCSLLPFFELCRLIRDQGVDILHLNGNKSIFLGALAKTLYPRLKIVAHEHGGVFDHRGWYLYVIRRLAGMVDLFVSLSQYRKSLLMRRCHIPQKKIRILYNFVDPARLGGGIKPEDHKRLNASGRSPVIGYLGGLTRIKGCDVLLRALPALQRRLGTFEVVIAGEGAERPGLERLAAQLGFAENVRFLGYVAEPAGVYADFDVMVMPSRSEAGPMCLYEAWTMGLPVVASNAPVLNEVIEDGVTGLLFESENPESLAEKIAVICNCDELVKKLRSASKVELEKHSIEKYLESLRDLYLSL